MLFHRIQNAESIEYGIRNTEYGMGNEKTGTYPQLRIGELETGYVECEVYDCVGLKRKSVKRNHGDERECGCVDECVEDDIGARY